MADSEKRAAEQIQAMGHIPLKITQAGRSAGGMLQKQISLPSIFKRVSRKELLLFTQEFETLFTAGLPLDRCLQVLIEITENEKLREIVEDVLIQVQGGAALADALATHPRIFPRLYVNMVRAGEAGGVLAPIFKRLADYLERSQELKENIVSALIYPCILVLFGASSIIFMITYVIPKFTAIFSDLGKSLPLSTAFIMWVSEVVRGYWWAMAGAVILIVGGVWYYSRTDEGGLMMDQIKLKLVILGDTIRKIETARFTRTLGTLISSGVPILNALNIVKEILGNRVMANALQEVSTGIRGGKGISEPLRMSGVFPPLALHLIEVGEETGSLDAMLLQVADTYDREIGYAIKRFVALLEPMMILLMGLLIGFVVVSMLLAIFSVNDLSL